MGIFDILGPVMVGPSSSHTAGAVRIGQFGRLLLGEEPGRAVIGLHGSFAATGEGHGTPLALLAGLLGMDPDDEGIPAAMEIARERGLDFRFETTDLGEVHPNSVRMALKGEDAALELRASSVGGGRIQVWGLDGFPVFLEGVYPTVLLVYPDRPGMLAMVTTILGNAGMNIATIKAHRDSRGGQALMTVELDHTPAVGILNALRHLPYMEQVRFVPRLGFGG
ncbi:L-serine ammonia-lyase, iron-sulfur-dependent subunit beta [Mesoterricola sediminis]|uniref:L-serine dehydratase n=1 Tax=Mesoterricola sediminis TaxID=2927980 RepID=A0AA48GZA0_9BACT|nr:L-serine ammonia-lyase, iron-sulfur-dependent subunit beta [Mesoterricola sediminis]BDU76787.1 L-serine dehydratase, iron-sulfur-dependent subunit beta [Mesoterricola sediminis]